MTWTLQNTALMNGVATNGMTVYAYTLTRLVNGIPATDGTVPDGNAADAGPATSANDPIYGDGYFTLAVADAEPYYFTASGGGDGHTYWLGPVTPVVSTTQQPYADGSNVLSTRAAPTAATAAAQTLPTATFTVNSTAGFLAAGKILVQANGIWQLVAYTGKTATTFTGCSGGTGSVFGTSAVLQGFQNGSRRRSVRIFFTCSGTASGDNAQLTPWTVVGGGALKQLGAVGILNVSSFIALALMIPFSVDPNGYYAAVGGGVGGGVLTLNQWFEEDQ